MKKLILGTILMVCSILVVFSFLMVNSVEKADTIVFESITKASVGEQVDITIDNRTASGEIVEVQEDGTKSVAISETGFLFGAGNNITELENNGVHNMKVSYEDNQNEYLNDFTVRRGTTELRDDLAPTRRVVKNSNQNS